MAKSIIEYLARDNLRAKFLDRTIPLQGASHVDVTGYSIDVPMRYTEFFATLVDGRTVRLKDPRQFVAWSGRASKRNYLFKGRHGRIEVQTETEQTTRIVRTATTERSFVARDGSQLVVHRWGRVFPVSMVAPSRDYEADGMYAFTQ
ncbi:hypothetical protein GWP57_01845 [Gammaproteobacteria bacterium]|jgi:hypothetical protein|nr:hypothetical protein [Gammaproteobacteria bacterium]